MKIKNDYIILVHGGAGMLARDHYTADEMIAFELGLKEALDQGYSILESGGTSLDAVQTAVMILEDNPLFNAGVGSVFNATGVNELDVSLMDGKTLLAGGISGSTKIKNPIAAARKVLDLSPHCLINGKGADDWAAEMGLELVDQDYFFTPKRWSQWHEVQLQKDSNQQPGHLDHSPAGTVGAVALDQAGNLSSATSTGGLCFKSPGRVSDSAIIGAGTYAKNATCAVSATGDGDYFIRCTTAADVSFMMEYLGLSLKEASRRCLQKVKTLGGSGGLIALDSLGNDVMIKTTSGMFRGKRGSNGETEIVIF